MSAMGAHPCDRPIMCLDRGCVTILFACLLLHYQACGFDSPFPPLRNDEQVLCMSSEDHR